MLILVHTTGCAWSH